MFSKSLITLTLFFAISLMISFSESVRSGNNEYPMDWPQVIYTSDFNNDLSSDLAVVSGLNNSAILLNNGSGDFTNLGSSYTGTMQRDIDGADFDGDGNLDLAFALWNFDYVAVRAGNGDGTFQSPVLYTLEGDLSRPPGLCIADFDGDDDDDIIVTENYYHVARFLSNDGDGTFTVGPSYATGFSPWGIAAADLDGDDDIDLAVALTGGDMSIMLNNGDGSFASPVGYPGGGGSNWIVAANLDGDTDIDVVMTTANTDSIAVYLNHSNGTFAPATMYQADSHPKSIIAADLDDDGDQEIITGNLGAGNISIFYNPGSGNLMPALNYNVGHGPWGIAGDDFDDDGDTDLAVTLSEDNMVRILQNDGTGTLYICGDANGDGTVNVADAVYLISYIFKGGPPPYSMEAADANADGDVNVGDVVYVIAYVFSGGPAPQCP